MENEAEPKSDTVAKAAMREHAVWNSCLVWKLHEIQIALLRRLAAMTQAVLPHASARAEWLLAGVIDGVASHGSEHPRLKEEMTARTQTQDQKPQYQMPTMTTSLLSPVNKPQPSRPQTCDRCSIAPLGAVCSLMYQHFPELEVLCGDHGVCSGVITDSLVVECTVYSLPTG